MQTASWLDEDLKYHDSATLRATAETLLEALYEEAGLKRRARDKHLPQLEIMLLGLLKASQTEYHCMAMSLGSGWFTGLKHLTYRVAVKLIVDGLIRLKFLIKHQGYDGGITGSVSRFQLTEPMLKFLSDSGLDPNLIYSSRPKTLVKIKPPKSKPHEKVVLTTAEKVDVLGLEDELTAYNARLKDTFIDLCVSKDEEVRINRRMARKAKSTGEYRKPRSS